MKTPPPIPARPHTHRHHGDERVDEWAWLSDRSDPEVEKVLREQDEFTRQFLQPTEPLQEEIFQEIKSRVQEDDETVPARLGPWSYFRRTAEGRQYPEHRRRDESGAEQLLLDENTLLERESPGGSYLQVGVFSVSPDQRLLAYGFDTDGSELFRVHVRDIESGEERTDELEGVYYGASWCSDNQTIYYTRVDDAVRPHQLWRHRLGTDIADDELLYQEDDERFFLGLGKTRSRDFIVLSLHSKTTSEVHVLDAHDPNARPRLVAQRRPDIIYDIDHHRESERFFLMTNEGAQNFRLLSCPVNNTEPTNWQPVIPSDAGVRLEDIDVFSRHLVLSERAEGNQRLRVLDLDTQAVHTIEQDEPVYTVGVGTNLEYESTILRYGYTSMVTPSSVFDYDMDHRSRELRKQQVVLGDFKRAHYESRREWATAPDGTKVPISLVFHRDTPLDGSAPLFQYGYGAYEHSVDPTFSIARLSLLDRGFVFAIAHVRGGGELGRDWYEDGKLMAKKNTFTDFIACTEHLVGEGYGAAGEVSIRGGSAGGALMGAVSNLRPDLYSAVVAEVPFVDCLTTMLDPSLPLTITEYEEWGNPQEQAAYEYIKSYSPFDNVVEQAYPAMLITGGWNDPRVSYWEPTKWVARLRQKTTSDESILLKIEMGAGHFGPSGRYDAWRDEALVLAFVINRAGKLQLAS